jgi:hypothetical protein
MRASAQPRVWPQLFKCAEDVGSEQLPRAGWPVVVGQREERGGDCSAEGGWVQFLQPLGKETAVDGGSLRMGAERERA